MASTITADTGAVSGSAGLKSSADSSGVLALATGTGTTAVTIDASQNVIVGGTTAVNTGASTGNITINGSGNAILNYTVAGAAKGWIYHDATNFEIYNNIAGAIKLFTNGSERMRIDSSGNVMVGVTSTSYRMEIANSTSGGYVGQSITNTNAAGYSRLTLAIGTNGANGQADLSYAPGVFFAIGPSANDTTTPIVFRNNNATERARIDSSGNLLVGTTSATPAGITAHKLVVERGTSVYAAAFGYSPDSSPRTQVTFYNSNGAVGTISTSGSSTTYATSSDYRLKNTVEPMTGALAKVAALKPVTYKWNVDGSDGEGFIAHELQSVVPDAVFGEKDAIDADGNPVYQGIDTSFLVATLTAAIQEQQALITNLTERLAVLEAK